MIRIEKALDECLEKLKGRLNNDFHDDFDDLDSIASGGLGSTSASINTRVVRFSVEERRFEKLQAENSKLEEDNARLRQEINELKRKLLGEDESEEKKREDKDMAPTGRRLELSERDVWSIVKSHQAHDKNS
jgi:cell division protein FtsB